MQAKTQKRIAIKTVLAVVLVRLLIYFIFSVFYIWLLSWTGIIAFSIRYVVTLTITIFFVWFFLNNLFSRPEKNA